MRIQIGGIRRRYSCVIVFQRRQIIAVTCGGIAYLAVIGISHLSAYGFGTEDCAIPRSLGISKIGQNFSAACAALDETIQIFSNRGSSLSDVILDCFGAGFGVLVIFLFLTRKAK